jgi:hypothetical protein
MVWYRHIHPEQAIKRDLSPNRLARNEQFQVSAFAANALLHLV